MTDTQPSDTADYDFTRISNLLHVVEKTRDYPKLKGIHDAAMQELESHANPPQPEPEPLAAEQEPGEAAQRTESDLRRSF